MRQLETELRRTAVRVIDNKRVGEAKWLLRHLQCAIEPTTFTAWAAVVTAYTAQGKAVAEVGTQLVIESGTVGVASKKRINVRCSS